MTPETLQLPAKLPLGPSAGEKKNVHTSSCHPGVASEGRGLEEKWKLRCSRAQHTIAVQGARRNRSASGCQVVIRQHQLRLW